MGLVKRQILVLITARLDREVVTGLLYVDPEARDLHAHLETADAPLNALAEAELCLGAAVLEKINAGLR
jgi:2-oxoglutarate ferredoxin oxidoreductase subunit beta